MSEGTNATTTLPQIANIPRPPSTPANRAATGHVGGARPNNAAPSIIRSSSSASNASNSSSDDLLGGGGSAVNKSAAQLNASSPFPQRSGKRRIDERSVAYATSLEQPLATGKRVYGPSSCGGGGDTSASSPSFSSSSPAGLKAGSTAVPLGAGVAAAVFGAGGGDVAVDGDSSPALARKYNEALYADMKLKNVQARVAAAAALKASGKTEGEEEELDDEGNPKPKKKKLGSMIGDYSPRKRIEDYMFLKQGKQWCPPTRYNGAIPQWESPKKKAAEGSESGGSDAPHRLTAKRQEELGERLVKPLKRDNPKKNKGPPPKPRKKADGTDMTPDEQAAYEKTLVKNLTKRLEGYMETSKKAREVALRNKEKEEAKLQKPVKKLDSPAAYEKLINSLYNEPLNKKRSESQARERKEAAAKEKLLHLTRKQQAESGRRLFEEGVARQRQAVAKAAERYLMRPASASPTAAYNRSRPDIESKYCPGLESTSVSSAPRPATARGTSPPNHHHIPKPPPSTARH